MADKRISQLIERTDIANNDVLPIVASGATTTNKVTISTIQTWMQDNLDVGVTSVGLSMPSAFVVSNSPVTASGNITVTGAGTVAQYIRGDGSLADFPTGGGGGSSVSYYLNGSVSQGTIGGIAYLEMNKTPILGAGTDFTINADGYIASFITDAGDPGLLEIPAGNWNFETYIQASSGGGSPTFYIELYKVNSGGTATLIASNSATPESISLGTNINPYFSALAVPQTTLALTDRLALRYYVTHAGRSITLHTENNTLCQIITTFTTGLTALNGLTAQVQNFATGTSGTDFNISSAGSTHTFNIPSASATARGLVTTGIQTIAGRKTFTDRVQIDDQLAVSREVSILSGSGEGFTFSLGNPSFNVFTPSGANGSIKYLRNGNAKWDVGFYGSANADNYKIYNSALGSVALSVSSSDNSTSFSGVVTTTSDSTINGVSIGKGAGSVATNTRLGFQTLVFNTTGSSNTSVGWSSLYLNTTGSANSSFGTLSLENNTTGTGNTAIGYVALRNNTTGGSNTATGYVALSANTTGNANTATGAYALENNTTGTNNTAVGYEALETNTTGGFNTALGLGSLKLNTTGGQNTVGGTYALYSNTTGSDNTAFGVNSMYKNTTGNSNTSSGITSLFGNTTGTANVAIGTGAGTYIADGSTENSITNNSIYIGSLTKALGNNQTNQIVIGHNAIGNGSNTVTIGNDSITSNIFSGNLSTRRAVGTASEGIIELRPNTGSSNIIIASGAVPLHILSTSGSLGLGVGSTPQVTIASGGAVTLTGALSGTSASFTGNVGINGSPGTSFPLEAYINSSTAHTTSSRGNVLRVYNPNTAANIFAGIELGGAGTANDGLAGINGVVTGSGSAALSFYTRDSNTFAERFRIASTGAATFSSTARIEGQFLQVVNATQPSVYINNTAVQWRSYLNSNNYAISDAVRDVLTLGYNGSPSFFQGGNVGIGTPTPNRPLTISSTTSDKLYLTGGTSQNGILLDSVGSSAQYYYGSGNNLLVTGDQGALVALNVSTSTAAMFFDSSNNIRFGATSSTERMRITSGGNVGINCTPSYQLEIQLPSGVNGQIVRMSRSAGAYGWGIGIDGANSNFNFYNNGGTSVANINNSTGAYTATSDERLKENIEYSQSAIDKLLDIKVRKFDWKDSEIKEDYGFVAQELFEVLPQYVLEGNEENYWGVAKAELVPFLVKAMQEQQEQIKSLTEQVEALKSQING